jgi:hypothetical protein
MAIRSVLGGDNAWVSDGSLAKTSTGDREVRSMHLTRWCRKICHPVKEVMATVKAQSGKGKTKM